MVLAQERVLVPVAGPGAAVLEREVVGEQGGVSYCMMPAQAPSPTRATGQPPRCGGLAAPKVAWTPCRNRRLLMGVVVNAASPSLQCVRA